MSTIDRPGQRVVPPLVAGEQLDRATFHERYEAMPPGTWAELVGGVVYMPSPVRLRRHGRPQAHLIHWLVGFEAATAGVIVADNTSVRLDLKNEPQPDAVLLIDPALGGQARISADDYIEEAPELVAEVAASSVSYDLDAKLKLFRRTGGDMAGKMMEALRTTVGDGVDIMIDFHGRPASVSHWRHD